MDKTTERHDYCGQCGCNTQRACVCSKDCRQHRKADGFTLVELLVVIVVIGLLAVVAIAGVSGITEQAESTSCEADLRIVLTAQSLSDATVGETATLAGLDTALTGSEYLVGGGWLDTPSSLHVWDAVTDSWEGVGTCAP